MGICIATKAHKGLDPPKQERESQRQTLKTSNNPIIVSIEHCGSRNFDSSLQLIKQKILKKYPKAKISEISVPGGTGAFEVTVQGRKIHSKLSGDGVVDESNLENFLEKVVSVGGD